jgi:hypothetical protein
VMFVLESAMQNSRRTIRIYDGNMALNTPMTEELEKRCRFSAFADIWLCAATSAATFVNRGHTLARLQSTAR